MKGEGTGACQGASLRRCQGGCEGGGERLVSGGEPAEAASLASFSASTSADLAEAFSRCAW